MVDNSSNLYQRLESQLGIRVVEDEVELPEDRPASECLAQVADFLIDQGYISSDDLPIRSGYKRYLINTDPKHQGGDDMIRPKTISGGCFIETNYNRQGIQRKLKQLIRLATN